MAKTVHVYHAEKGWAVKRDSGSASRVFSTQKEAIERARSLARGATPSQIVVYGRDGSIKDHVTYGLPRIQDPPQKGAGAHRIQKAVGRMALTRLAADPHPPSV